MNASLTSRAPALSFGRRWTVLGICALALFLVGLDTTIVTVGLPEIGRGLGVAEDRLAWIVDAYTVVFASLLISSGALADRFGRRRVFQLGLTIFGVTSLLCAAAPTAGVLVAARAAQGVGASMLAPVALAIVVNTMRDARERAIAIGFWGSVFGLSLAAGPVTGGALIALFDWRAVFWINVPVVAVALILVAALVPESRGDRVRRLDLAGQVLLVALLGVGVAILIEGPRVGWGSPWVVGGYAALAALTITFATVEARRRSPLIDPGLFRSLRFTGAVLGAVAVFIALSVTLLTSTVFLQGALGWTPLAAGAATLPLAVSTIFGPPLSGALVSKFGTGPSLLLAGTALVAGGALSIAAMTAAHIPLLLSAFCVTGIGVGFANAPITHTAVEGLPRERAGVAGGIASTARQVGTAIGIALAGGLTAGTTPDQLPASAAGSWWVVIACGGVLLGIAVGAGAFSRARPDGPHDSRSREA